MLNPWDSLSFHVQNECINEATCVEHGDSSIDGLQASREIYKSVSSLNAAGAIATEINV